jgi:hypothetical protein
MTINEQLDAAEDCIKNAQVNLAGSSADPYIRIALGQICDSLELVVAALRDAAKEK